jgi:DNA modification methylase
MEREAQSRTAPADDHAAPGVSEKAHRRASGANQVAASGATQVQRSVESTDRVRVLVGDCRDRVRDLPDASIDSIVTDTPYGLGFMGESWDREIPGPEYWTAFLRVAKPGAHLAAFGGTRTFHRLACAIEDGGWEIRDTLSWLYGQGFPKSRDVGGGRGTALKPGWEPIILARKPVEGRVEDNVRDHGTGALNIDACRIDVPDQKGGPSYARGSSRVVGREHGDGIGFAVRAGDPNDGLGRWPANVVLDEEAAALLDAQSGLLTSGSSAGFVGDVRESVALGRKRSLIRAESVYADTGGASRFFYCAKATKAERGPGNDHPTVKPILLMRWIVRLVTPVGGTVLDPFAGSGTTGVAALSEGFHAVLIERVERYAALIDERLRGLQLPLVPEASR